MKKKLPLNDPDFTRFMPRSVDREARRRIHELDEQSGDGEIADRCGRVSRREAILVATSTEHSEPRVPSPITARPDAIEEPGVEICALKASGAGFSSPIVVVFPKPFAEFLRTPVTLLWRGSGGGFRASLCYRHCDCYAPTLIAIKDTVGNGFGGFTSMVGESRKGKRNGIKCFKRGGA
jgi:hypothetical protein